MSRESNCFAYYKELLDMYSKVSKRKKNAGCKGLLKKELMRMKKEARSVIWNTPHIDLKSKLYMEVATCTPRGYVFLGRLLRKRK